MPKNTEDIPKNTEYIILEPKNTEDKNKSLTKRISSWFKNNYMDIIWVLILIGILFFVNWVIYYFFYNPTNNVPGLWNYITSDGFKIITVSFILPIFLLIFGQIFKIRDRSILRRENKALRDKDQIKEYQLDTINDTLNLFRDLIALTTKVRFYNKTSEAGKPEAEKPEAEKPEAEKPEAEKPEAEKTEAEKTEAEKSIETSIGDIRTQIDELIIREEHLKNMWGFRFKRLKDSKGFRMDNLRTPIYVLLSTTYTVAKHIHDGTRLWDKRKDDDRLSIKELQYYLGVIETNIKNTAYVRVISALYNNMSYEYYDDDKYYEGNKGSKDDAEDRMNFDLDYLMKWCHSTHKCIKKHNQPTDFLWMELLERKSEYTEESKACENWEEKCKKELESIHSEKELDSDLKRKLYKTDKIKNELAIDLKRKLYKTNTIKDMAKDYIFRELFFKKIENFRTVQSTKVCYSDKFIRILAKQWDIENLCNEIIDRAIWDVFDCKIEEPPCSEKIFN